MSTSQLILIWAVPVLFAITVHEIAHGWVAARFGDTTARDAGRLTLNPIPHIHWLGTVVLPLALGTLVGVVAGWAKPVPVNAGRLQNPRRDMAWVAVAGPAANVLMALAWAGISRMGWQMGVESEFGLLVYLIGQAGIMVNIVLMLFNLLPIPPLDGAVIVSSVLPPRWGRGGITCLEPKESWWPWVSCCSPCGAGHFCRFSS